jgi:hypothetical protein
VAILCTDRFNFQQIYILLKEGIFTVFLCFSQQKAICSLYVFTQLALQLIRCVFTGRDELKLYIEFRLIFVCKGLISCVYYMTLRVSIGHIMFRLPPKFVVYCVKNRLMIQTQGKN